MAGRAGQPTGTLGYSRFQDHTAEIQQFYVADEARGKSAGRALLTQVLARLTAAALDRSDAAEGMHRVADEVAIRPSASLPG